MSTTELPLVTIGIPTYNRADGYLREAISAALAQTYPRLEIVVADNVSEDRTADVVAAVGGERVKYRRHEVNVGAQGNFNSIVAMAEGEYLLVLHDDDTVDPTFVAACVEAMGSGRPGLVRTGTRVIGQDGAVIYQRRNQAPGGGVKPLFEAWFARKTSLYFCSTLFHTATLRGTGGFDTPRQVFNDVASYARVAAEAGTVEVPDVLATFRRHVSNAGKARTVAAWAEDAKYVVDLLTELVSPAETMPDTEFRAAALEYFCSNCYTRASRLADPKERREAMTLVHRTLGCARPPWRHDLTRFANKLRRRVGSQSL